MANSEHQSYYPTQEEVIKKCFLKKIKIKNEQVVPKKKIVSLKRYRFEFLKRIFSRQIILNILCILGMVSNLQRKFLI